MERIELFNTARRTLEHSLEAIDLRPVQDFAVDDVDDYGQYLKLILFDVKLLDVDLLSACDGFLSSQDYHWGLVIYCELSKKISPLVELSGGGFTFLDGGEVVRSAVLESWSRKGFPQDL